MNNGVTQIGSVRTIMTYEAPCCSTRETLNNATISHTERLDNNTNPTQKTQFSLRDIEKILSQIFI